MATVTEFLSALRQGCGNYVGAAVDAAARKLGLSGWSSEEAGGWALADGCSVIWNTRREDRYEEADILLGEPAEGLGLSALSLTIGAPSGEWRLNRRGWERMEVALSRLIDADEDRRAQALRRFAEDLGEGRWVRRGRWVEVAPDGITCGCSCTTEPTVHAYSSWPEVNRAMERARYFARMAAREEMA